MQLVETGLRKAQSDPVCTCKLRVLKAQLLVARQPTESLRLLANSLPVQVSGTEFPARRELILGEANASLGALREAELHLADARSLASSFAPQLLARVALAQGNLAGRRKNQQEAEQDYRLALDLARKYSQPAAELDALVDLGYMMVQRERFDEAMNRFVAALEKARALHNAVAEELSLGNLGDSYLELGNSDQSIPLLEQAEKAAARLGEKRHQQIWSGLQGNAYLSRRDYSRAQNHYSDALSLAENLKDRELIVLAYHNLAQLELAQGKLDEAEEFSRRAFAAEGLSPGDRSDPYLVLTAAEIAQMRHQYPQAEALLQSVLHNPDADSSLRWQAESDLANVYVAQKQFAQAEGEFQSALQIVEKASGEIKQEERRMSILDAWPFYDDYIRFLVDSNNPQKALQVAEFSRARTLADAFGIDAQKRASSLQIARVRSTLAVRKQVILAYWLSDKESYLWAITPDKFQLFHLPGQAEIEQAIQDNERQILKDYEVGESTAAQRLYEMLVKPAEALLPRNARVTIVPNRSLYRLNFETLVVPGPAPHYWIKDVLVDNAGSIALLLDARHRQAKRPQGTLVVGAPLEVSKDFPALKHSTEEMQKVENHFGDGSNRVISGKDANPSAYRLSEPGQYGVIHFVSHGTASETRPLDSAIILSPDSDGSYKLYARDIAKVPLHADLVTISACYGMGAKTYSGEGLVGLAWAFMRAGAHQVVAALWEVDEASSPQLMDDFYSGRSKGKSAAEALRDAKLKMLDSPTFDRHPYYWASLQLYTGS